jgi:hypothetical protein
MQRELRVLFIVVVGTLFMAGVATAHAQPVEFGVQASLADNDLDFGIGARLITDFDALGDHVKFIGTFDYFFPNVGNYWELNGNAVYVFAPRHSTLRPYLGGGLNLGHYSGGGASDSKPGLNLVGGINFRGRSLKPFVEAKVEIRDDGPFVVSAGFRF